jgi:hypothetical protein
MKVKRLDRLTKKIEKIHPKREKLISYLSYDEFTKKEIEFLKTEIDKVPLYFISKLFNFLKEQGQDSKGKEWADPIPMEKRVFKKSHVIRGKTEEEAVHELKKELLKEKGMILRIKK